MLCRNSRCACVRASARARVCVCVLSFCSDFPVWAGLWEHFYCRSVNEGINKPPTVSPTVGINKSLFPKQYGSTSHCFPNSRDQQVTVFPTVGINKSLTVSQTVGINKSLTVSQTVGINRPLTVSQTGINKSLTVSQTVGIN